MNDETIIILGIILLGVGAIIGALTYHLIVYRFSNKIEKQLDKSIKNYENFVLKTEIPKSTSNHSMLR